MLKFGAILISTWAVINGLLATFILFSVVFLNKEPLIARVVFSETELTHLNPQALAIIKSLAILFNSLSLAFSVLVLFVVWQGLITSNVWVFWGLLITIGLVQIMQFIADSKIGNKTLPASIILTIIYLLGILLLGIAIFRK